jgi:hypothetical protein
MPYCLGSYNWVQDPETNEYLYNVAMAGYNTSETSQLSEKEQEKIQKAVQKAFEDLTVNVVGEDGVAIEESVDLP